MTKKQLIAALTGFDDDEEVLAVVGNGGKVRRITRVSSFRFEPDEGFLQHKGSQCAPDNVAVLTLSPYVKPQ